MSINFLGNNINLTLSGTEETVLGIRTYYALITNNSDADVYASASHETPKQFIAYPGKTIAVPIPVNKNALYLLGTGNVSVKFTDYVDEETLNKANDYAETMLRSRTGVPNLLINPDFKINQRGQTEYTAGYTVDRWKTQEKCVVSVLNNGIEVRPSAAIKANTSALSQIIECPEFLVGEPITFSTNISIANDYAYIQILALDSAGKELSFSRKQKLEEGFNFVIMDSVPEGTATLRVQYTLNAGADTDSVIAAGWAKLEHGKAYTSFFYPEYSSELLKCQRYYQISSKEIPLSDIRPCMRSAVTSKQLGDCYIYEAEL